MSTNRKSEVGGPGTGISLHSAGSISARQHGDTLAELTRRLEEMSTQTPDTSIYEDVIYLEVVPEVKGRVYGLGSQGYHRSVSLGEASSSRRPAYGPYELEELQQDYQKLQETLLKERMERQEQMPHVPPTPRTPPSPVIERSGPHSDDQPGHLTTDIAPSHSAHPDDHQLGHWTDPHRRMPEDQRHLLDDHDEFMSQLMPPPRCLAAPAIAAGLAAPAIATDNLLNVKSRKCKVKEMLLQQLLQAVMLLGGVMIASESYQNKLKALGIDNILGFDWLASPAPEAMIRTLEVLYARGVLDEDDKLTSPIGFQVSEIPLRQTTFVLTGKISNRPKSVVE
ncbi:hypothetical protein Syun_000813 [Stephania yunnanensis]|uniref:Uncharacterized protein n=1 Tax=Stephania yunnanensis TaxID=152371 RepID=A0AAP0LCM2_9MAGN